MSNLTLDHSSDNIKKADAVIEEMKKQRDFLELEQAVIEMHQSGFNAMTIKKHGKPTKVYRTKHCGKLIEAKDYHMFILKVAYAYGIRENPQCMTLNAVFQKALKEKEETENINNNTKLKIQADYRRFFNEELQKKAVNEISEIDLKAYSQTLTRSQKLTKKAFLAYKGVLNLIFEYAMQHRLITNNPVNAIKNNVYLKNCRSSKAKNTEKIFSEKEIEEIKAEMLKRTTQARYHGYCGNAYIALLSIETGMRAGELCSLKNTDILPDCIHIHTQQLALKNTPENLEYVQDMEYPYSVNTGTIYYDVPYTKNEKGISEGGRFFPITPEIRNILVMNNQAKYHLDLDCEYVFCTHENEWIKTHAYETFLRRALKSLGFDITNNHAFRMSLNSNVLLPSELDTGDRAYLLGHSITTNLNHYSFARKGTLNRATQALSAKNDNDTESNDVVIPDHSNVIPFPQKKKSLKSNEFKAFH